MHETKGRLFLSTQEHPRITFGTNFKNFSGFFKFGLTLNETGKLTVDKSDFHFYHGDYPLFRYEYLKNANPKVPSSHLHIHATADNFKSLKRKKGRRKIDEMSDAHFTLGGEDMRPSLEEILLNCNEEFDLDFTPEQKCILRKSMEEFKQAEALSIALKYQSILEAAGWKAPQRDKSLF